MDSSHEEFANEHGSIDVAMRLDKSVDIVAGLTEVIQEELPKKSSQGSSAGATNTTILQAIKDLDEKIDQKLNIEPIPEQQITSLFNG